MKIVVTVTVEMTDGQLKAYAEEYGLDPKDKRGIRKDVKAYVGNSITQSYPAMEIGVWEVDYK